MDLDRQESDNLNTELLLHHLNSINSSYKLASKFFRLSLIPKYRDDYDADICWHGCDKVSRLLDFGGGGGS